MNDLTRHLQWQKQADAPPLAVGPTLWEAWQRSLRDLEAPETEPSRRTELLRELAEHCLPVTSILREEIGSIPGAMNDLKGTALADALRRGIDRRWGSVTA